MKKFAVSNKACIFVSHSITITQKLKIMATKTKTQKEVKTYRNTVEISKNLCYLRKEVFYTNTMDEADVYIFTFEDYSECLDAFKKTCEESGRTLAMSNGYIRITIVHGYSQTLGFDTTIKSIDKRKERAVPANFMNEVF